MIVCPNCAHQNPEGAVQCEACYTPLPSMRDCPSCGAQVQSDASFCGQCGANLNAPPPQPSPLPSVEPGLVEPGLSADPSNPLLSDIPDLNLPDIQVPNLSSPDPSAAPEVEGALAEAEAPGEAAVAAEAPIPLPHSPDEGDAGGNGGEVSSHGQPESGMAMGMSADNDANAIAPAAAHPSTQLQTQTLRLVHTQTNTSLEMPRHLNIIHIGKPNDRIPPDIDVSGFPDSEVVSRIHADIRVEGDQYYIEDSGSSNGTYINNVPLLPGNRHRLRSGDRVALGKGDKVSFIVQIT